MKFQSKHLLEELSSQTKQLIALGEKLKFLSEEKLNQRPGSESWSALECLEHLNLYGDFYLPTIQQKIASAQGSGQTSTTFKSGWVGNYFANSMLPKDGKVRGMKTFKDKNPINSKLNSSTIDRFLEQQRQMLVLLAQAEKVDLARVKVNISISKWVKLKLGDTFRFLINHNVRHMLQANRAAGLVN